MLKLRYFSGSSFLICCLVISIDQTSKYFAQELLVNRTVYIMQYLNFTLVYNAGAAFSIFADLGGSQRWGLILVELIAIGVILFWINRLQPQEKNLRLALNLVLSGAIGNLIDRFYNGVVVDFIDIHYRIWHFPTFNIADIMINFGAFLLIRDSFRYITKTT